jgi:hypothetical protein
LQHSFFIIYSLFFFKIKFRLGDGQLFSLILSLPKDPFTYFIWIYPKQNSGAAILVSRFILLSYSGRRRWSTRQLLLLCYIDNDDDGRFIFVWLYTHINDKI